MLVSTRFQVLFHSPPGVLFTFPSRYCSSIGHQVVFRLGWWSTRLPTGFHVSRGTLDTGCQSSLSNTGLSPSMAGLPMPFGCIISLLLLVSCATHGRSHNTIYATLHAYTRIWFRLRPVRSPLLGASHMFSFPPATKMFQFAGCPPYIYVFNIR